MGAICYSIDRELAKLLAAQFKISVFIETGTFHGDSVVLVRDIFQEIHTCELSPELYIKAAKRFKGEENVNCYPGLSVDFLRSLTAKFSHVSVMYWLDAHWCASKNTAGKKSQCPLLKELAAIGQIGSSSVIGIDDARLFMAPPTAVHAVDNWPTLDEVLAGLRKAAPQHRILIVNDVIWVVPAAGFAALHQYAARYGVDWLEFAEKARMYDALAMQLVEKDIEITKGRERAEALLLERRAWRLAGFLFWPFQRIILSLIKKKKALTKVRLGELHQHPPHYYSFYVGNLPQVRKPMPTISVVTPTYNQGRFLSQTIQSVLAQKYPALQYVVQDGASEDNSAEVIQKYAKALHAWESVSDRGQAHAINLGFEKTSGEIMAWLNGDDLHTPITLAYVARYFQNNPHVDVVYGHRLIINEKNQKIGNWIMPKHDDEILSWVDYVPQETLFWRRKIWQKIGGALDETFDFALDWDLLLKFRNVGAKIVRLPVLLGCFRVHASQKTSRELGKQGKKEMDILRQRIHGKTITDLEIFNATKKYLRQSIYCNLAWQVRSYQRKLFFERKRSETEKVCLFS